MRRIAEAAREDLHWSQPRARKREYELQSSGQLVAKLTFRSGWGTFATAESADGCWTFKRVGFWQNKASIRGCGSEADIATFANNTWKGGGTLRFTDGAEFKATTTSERVSLGLRR
jgi:hypothetical protein